MSLIEGHPQYKRNDARPGIIINVDHSAYRARRLTLEFRQKQQNTIDKQSQDIAELQETMRTLMGRLTGVPEKLTHG